MFVPVNRRRYRNLVVNVTASTICVLAALSIVLPVLVNRDDLGALPAVTILAALAFGGLFVWMAVRASFAGVELYPDTVKVRRLMGDKVVKRRDVDRLEVSGGGGWLAGRGRIVMRDGSVLPLDTLGFGRRERLEELAERFNRDLRRGGGVNDGFE